MMRSIFATLMAVMVAGSYAQTNSSSSTGASFSSSSVIANISVSSSVVPNATISSSSLPVFNASSAIPSVSSSSTGMGPIIPGFNGSSSSSVWIMSSSSTGADNQALYPAGTQEVSFQVELASGVLASGLADALARDFAATIARQPEYNVTAEALYEYIRMTVNAPETNQASNSTGRVLLAVGPANTTAVAVILGNVTNVVVIGNARDLAVTFYNAAASGDVVVSSAQAYGVRVYPQQVVVIDSPNAAPHNDDDGNNGASSAASASLLIGSMIAALALAF